MNRPQNYRVNIKYKKPNTLDPIIFLSRWQ
jgi:hypothetical protein